MNNKKKILNKDLYLNKSGNNSYLTPNSVENLIRYITRTNGQDDSDLVAWGCYGAPDFLGIEAVINEFISIQKQYKRNGDFGRYIDHTIYSFSPESKEFIEKYDVDVESIARHMAYDIYTSDDCQVVYAVHNHIENSKEHLHIHFAINTINFSTSKKRRENKQLTNARQKEFRNYVDDIFEDYK